MKHQVHITEQTEEDTADILKLDCSFLILSWPACDLQVPEILWETSYEEGLPKHIRLGMH